MPVVDDRTSNLSLALPNAANSLQDDVGRLRSALSDLDTYAGVVNTHLTSIQDIAHGGTGQTTAAAAINALVPSQAGNAAKSLITDGGAVFWGTPAGVGGGGGVGQVPLTLANGSSDPIDITAASDLIALGVSSSLTMGKTMDVYVGASNIGWKDLTGEIIAKTSGVGAPTFAQIGSTVYYAYKFAVNDACWINYHINHDYKPGGQILLHTHWISDGTDTTNGVKWEFYYNIAKGHNQSSGGTFALASPNTVTVQSVSGGQYRHMVSEISTTIDVTNAEVDSVIMVRVRRITNGATDSTNGIFLLTADCHYQMSRFATPNRAPDFYA